MPPRRKGGELPTEPLRKSRRIIEQEQAEQSSSSQPEPKPRHFIYNAEGRPQTPDPFFITAARKAVEGIPMFGGDQGPGSYAEAGSAILSQRVSELRLDDPLQHVFRLVAHEETRYDRVKAALSRYPDQHPERQEIDQMKQNLEQIPDLICQGKAKEAREYLEAIRQQGERIQDQELRKLCEDLESMHVSEDQLIWETLQRFRHQGEDGQPPIERAFDDMYELYADWASVSHEHSQDASKCLGILQNLRQIGEHDREKAVAHYKELKELVKTVDHPAVRGIWQDLHSMTSSAILSQGISELRLADPLQHVFRLVAHRRTRYDGVMATLSRYPNQHPERQEIDQMKQNLEQIPDLICQGKAKEAREYLEAIRQQGERIQDQELRKLCEDLESMHVSEDQLIWETLQRFRHQGEDGQPRIERAFDDMQGLIAIWEYMSGPDPDHPEVVPDDPQVMEELVEHGKNCETTLRVLCRTGKDDRETSVALYKQLKEQVETFDHPEVRGIWQRLNNMTSIEKEFHNQGWEFDRSNPDYDFPQVVEVKRWRPLVRQDNEDGVPEDVVPVEDVPTVQQCQRACYSLTAGSFVVPYFIDHINAELRTAPEGSEQQKVLQAVKKKLENRQVLLQDFPQKDGKPLYKEIIPYFPALADKCEKSVSLVIKQLHDGEPARKGEIYVTYESNAFSDILRKKDIDVKDYVIRGLMIRKSIAVNVKKGGRDYARCEVIEEGEDYQQKFQQCWNRESIRMVIDLHLNNKPTFVVAGVPKDGEVIVSNQSNSASTYKTGDARTFRDIAIKNAENAEKEIQEFYRVYAYPGQSEE